MSEIATASFEQTAGIDQVNSAMTLIEETTQQNATLVEQAAAASASLDEQHSLYLMLLACFRLNATAVGKLTNIIDIHKN